MAKLRERNSERSTIGSFWVVSQISQAMNPTTAMQASATIAGELNQSASLPVSSMTCSEPTQTTSNERPMVSTGTRRVGVSRWARLRQLMKAHSAPIGTLMKKIHGQDQLSEM